jgi:hypothetical protein
MVNEVLNVKYDYYLLDLGSFLSHGVISTLTQPLPKGEEM